MKTHDFEISGVDFKLAEWGMMKQLQNENVVMPLLKEPMVNATALADGLDESGFLAAVIDGILGALAEIDMLKLVTILLEGSAFRTEGGGFKDATIENLEQDGRISLGDVHILATKIIQINYHALIKKDLAGLLQNLMK